MKHRPIPSEPDPTVRIRFEFDNESRLVGAVQEVDRGVEWYDARLELAHLSLMSGFDELVCLDRLPIQKFWYQIETVKKVLKYFGGRALLADEVGLGKTIEAGILAKEYILRVLNDKIHMFELVVGEIDTILGNVEGDADFSDIVLDIWPKSTTETDLREEFDALADRLLHAKAAYRESKQLDEALFAGDYEV